MIIIIISRSYFSTGPFAQTCTALLQIDAAKFEKGVEWMREILYKTVFTKDRIEVIAQKIINEVAQAKRNGKNVANYAMEGLRYVKGKEKTVHCHIFYMCIFVFCF